MAGVAAQSIKEVKESMQRCLSNPEFINRFHEAFLSNAEVQEKFKNTNSIMQKAIMKSTLHVMLNAAIGVPGVGMLRFAVSHDRNNKDIPAHLYQHWLVAVLVAVKATDENFSETVENAWHEVMLPGINFMIEMH